MDLLADTIMVLDDLLLPSPLWSPLLVVVAWPAAIVEVLPPLLLLGSVATARATKMERSDFENCIVKTDWFWRSELDKDYQIWLSVGNWTR